jgi:hypothetical protein
MLHIVLRHLEHPHLLAQACVSIRQHTSAYVSIRQHTSAYVSIRHHTSAYVSRCFTSSSVTLEHAHLLIISKRVNVPSLPSRYVSIRQHTSAYVSTLSHQRDSTCRRCHQHTSAFVSIRQHTSAHLLIKKTQRVVVAVDINRAICVTISQSQVLSYLCMRP